MQSPQLFNSFNQQLMMKQEASVYTRNSTINMKIYQRYAMI